MSTRDSQGWYVASGATLQLPPRMRLASDERERLWKGLERFANCGDSADDFQALGHAFPHFWPVDIRHFPKQETTEPFAAPLLGAQMAFPASSENRKRELSDLELERKADGMSDEEQARLSETESLNWHPACHKLFLVYRDMLRRVWHGPREATGWLVHGEPEFLLGVAPWIERAHEDAKKREPSIFPHAPYPYELYDAWEEILREFPTAWPESPREFRLIWDRGDIELVPGNDFQRAFFLLFRESWRARICPRCDINKFFIASRPKQVFCGTVCSAGSRLTSKMKWWRRVGSKRRAAQSKTHRARGAHRRERKPQ